MIVNPDNNSPRRYIDNMVNQKVVNSNNNVLLSNYKQVKSNYQR